MTDEQQRSQLLKVQQLHHDQFQAEMEQAAQIESFELTYRMQTAAPEAIDLKDRTKRLGRGSFNLHSGWSPGVSRTTARFPRARDRLGGGSGSASR
jgi:hypothetical protein